MEYWSDGNPNTPSLQYSITPTQEQTMDQNDKYYRLRHTATHVMAEAVGELFPGVKYAIGPPIEDGFYYDMEFEKPIGEDDLARIEERMREISARDLAIVRKEMAR